MKEKTDKLITWVVLGIAILASLFAVFFATNTQNEGMFNIAYWITFIFVILALLGMVCFFLLRFVKNFSEDPAKARKSLIVMGVSIVVVLVSFLCSRNELDQLALNKYEITESTSRWIGAGCILVYILVAAAILSIIYVECSKSLKKK